MGHAGDVLGFMTFHFHLLLLGVDEGKKSAPLPLYMSSLMWDAQIFRTWQRCAWLSYESILVAVSF